jgi:hypothetical protein
MTDYVKSTNFTSKDSLAVGNPLKIVKGAEFDTEFNNIATAVATKADSSPVNAELALKAPIASPTFTGTPAAPTAAVNTNTTQVATTAFVVAQIADDAPTKTGTGASGTWGISISGNAATATTASLASTATTVSDDAITKDKLQSPVAGTNYLICRTQEAVRETFVGSYPDAGLHRFVSPDTHLGVAVLVPGTVTCYVEHCTQSASSPAYVRILKNGSQIAEWSTTSTAFVARSVNVSVDVGDVLIFQQRSGNPDFGAAYWKALRTYSNNPSMAVA